MLLEIFNKFLMAPCAAKGISLEVGGIRWLVPHFFIIQCFAPTLHISNKVAFLNYFQSTQT